MESSTSRFRVAIIGGGIGGLILGQLLSNHPSIEAHVYERNEQGEDRLVGYRIQISVETLRLLEAYLPSETWNGVRASVGKTPKEGYYHSCFMRPGGHIFYTYIPEEFKNTVAVSRARLRKGLLHNCDGFLRVGKKFTHYRELKDGSIEAHFADGSHQVCDLLVGADGISSRVRRQLLPDVKTVQTDIAIIYFKVPYTREVESMIPYKTGCLVLYPNGQEITIMTWQNPDESYAKGLDPDNIDPETSYVMLGFGSRVDTFVTSSKPPNNMTSTELKAECISRVHRHPTHSSIKALVELIVTNSAYINLFRMVDVPKPWESANITLLGDATFNMAPFLGKGAACAMIDAIDVAKVIAQLPSASQAKRREDFKKYVAAMMRRRLKERHRSAFVMNLCFFGTTPFRAAIRDYGMQMANFWLTGSSTIIKLGFVLGLILVVFWGTRGI